MLLNIGEMFKGKKSIRLPFQKLCGQKIKIEFYTKREKSGVLIWKLGIFWGREMEVSVTIILLLFIDKCTVNI